MKIQAYIHNPVFRETIRIPQNLRNHKVRSKWMLDLKLRELENLARGIPWGNSLNLILSYEDFFGGAEICTEFEEENNTARCIDRDTAYDFFKNEMSKLSARYPHILFIPGSIYLSVDKSRSDFSRYSQENKDRKNTFLSKLYVQNVAPVFFQGKWVKLIKKGSYLEQGKKQITSENDFAKAIMQSINKISVTDYHEDELTDINNGLVFFGLTPLPGESNKLDELNIVHHNFFNPIFSIDGFDIGLEICADHTKHIFESESTLDLHLVSSNGVCQTYAHINKRGYYIQSDYDFIHIANAEGKEIRLHRNNNSNQLSQLPTFIKFSLIRLSMFHNKAGESYFMMLRSDNQIISKRNNSLSYESPF